MSKYYLKALAMMTLLAGPGSVGPLTGALPDSSRTYPEAEAWPIGWPSVHGPFGNFLPLRTGVKIADDLCQARLQWQSEGCDFGLAKTGSKTFGSAADITARLGPEARAHPGSWAGVIVAEGKVFGSSFRPCGEVFTAPVKGESARFRLDAEDLVIALDAQTGKLVWKAVEPGGLVLSGGKRGGFQVTPVYYQGKVFSLGSTGRLFAHDAASGEKIWQSDIGPAHRQVAKTRDKILANAAQGKWTDPDGPGWHTSLIVADGVLVVPTFAGRSGGGRDTDLRGVDIETGRTLWEAPGAVSKWATPNVWRHGEREYVLCATVGGRLHLLDPRDGRELWKVEGLGPNYSTLSPSATHVLVNVAGPVDPKAKRVPGFYGAYRITNQGAELAWRMPEEDRNQIPTWFDTCARQRYMIRDGLVYVVTEGTKEAPGRFLLLEETTGKILADHQNLGADTAQIGGLFYLVEDRLLCRTDSAHGPTHGGRHPFVQWAVGPGRIARLGDDTRLCSMDLAEFATAYEVYMETPVVAGRMFERTLDGGLACYDLRQPERLSVWELDLRGGWIGVPSLPVRLWIRPDGTVFGGKTYPPADREIGLPFGQARRFARWEQIGSLDAKVFGERLTGTVRLGFGSHSWPVRLDLTRSGDTVTGTWERSVTALEKPVIATGSVSGHGPTDERLYPTPWLAGQPWTSFGPSPAGARSWVIQLGDAITMGKKPAGLTICLLHDGRKVTQGGAAAFGYSQAWHEIDASQLRVTEKSVAGPLQVVLNGDWWFNPNSAAGTGIAGRLEIEATAKDEQLSGSYKVEWGIPWTATGTVRGAVVRKSRP